MQVTQREVLARLLQKLSGLVRVRLHRAPICRCHIKFPSTDRMITVYNASLPFWRTCRVTVSRSNSVGPSAILSERLVRYRRSSA